MHKTFKTRSYLYFASTAIFMLISLLILYKRNIVKICNEPLPCHCSETRDALHSADDPKFSPKARSIFFHETSCRNGLTFRQACSVEAAARAHPEREVYVLFSSPVTDYELRTGCLAELLNITNVKFLRVHLAEHAKETLVHSMLLNDVKKSRFRIQHTADILRILTLNKWGGIYLDTDMIVTRSLDNLPSNFVAKQGEDDIASAILSFAKDEIGTFVTNEIIKEISKIYNPTHWSDIGAQAIEEVLLRLCPKVMLSSAYLVKPVSNCKGVVIFSPELFYPHAYPDVDEIFEDPAPNNFDLSRPYAYHMYHYLGFNKTIRRGTVYELVAQAFCPTIHTKYYHEFSNPALETKPID